MGAIHGARILTSTANRGSRKRRSPMPRSVLSRVLCGLRSYLESDRSFFIHLAESQRHAG